MDLFDNDNDTLSLVIARIPQAAPAPRPLTTTIESTLWEHTLKVRRRLFRIGVGVLTCV